MVQDLLLFSGLLAVREVVEGEHTGLWTLWAQVLPLGVWCKGG